MGNYNDFDLDVKVGSKTLAGARAHSDGYVCGTTNSPTYVCATKSTCKNCKPPATNNCHTYKPCSNGCR